MKRQINLVNPALLPPKPFFQFRSMMLALTVLAAGLLLLGTFMLSRLGIYEAAAEQAQKNLLAKQAQVKLQEQVLVKRQPDLQVATRLEALRAEQDDLQRIDQALQAGGLPGQSGDRASSASAYLYELARQPLPNVWLTDIQLRGKDISLQGMASNAAAIPATLALLNRLPAFQGQNFAAFEAGRKLLTTADPAKPVEVLNFRLESAAARETVR